MNNLYSAASLNGNIDISADSLEVSQDLIIGKDLTILGDLDVAGSIIGHIVTQDQPAVNHNTLGNLLIDDVHLQYLPLNCIRSLTGILDAGTHKIERVVNSALTTGAINKGYVDRYPSELINLTVTEIQQLENIGLTEIDAGEWSIVGNLDQDLITTSDVSFNSVDALTLKINGSALNSELTNLTTSEIQQLKNINTNTISTTQWGYLSNLDQDLTTTSDVSFNSVDALTLKINGSALNSELTNLTTSEIQQLKNINTNTISTTQWGYLSNLDQDLTTTSDVSFNSAIIDNDITMQTYSLIDRVYQVQRDMSEPTGFLSTALTDTILTTDDITRSVTISPTGSSFIYRIKGILYTKSTPDTVILDNISGTHWVYYDGSILKSSMAPSQILFINFPLVCTVYYNAVTAKIYICLKAQHGMSMPGATHWYLHSILGIQYFSGLACSGFTIGNGSLDSHMQFAVENGILLNEDLEHQIVGGSPQILSPIARIPLFYKLGTAGIWTRYISLGGSPVYKGVSRAYYNYYNIATLTWTLVECTNNYYSYIYLFATADIDNSIVGIMGQTQYLQVSVARDALPIDTRNVVTSGLPMVDFRLIGTILFKTSNLMTNQYASAVVTYETPIGAIYADFRIVRVEASMGLPTAHGSLSGLSADDHVQYYLANGSRPMMGALNMNTYDINGCSSINAPNNLIVDSIGTTLIRSAAANTNALIIQTTNVIGGINVISMDKINMTASSIDINSIYMLSPNGGINMLSSKEIQLQTSVGHILLNASNNQLQLKGSSSTLIECTLAATDDSIRLLSYNGGIQFDSYTKYAINTNTYILSCILGAVINANDVIALTSSASTSVNSIYLHSLNGGINVNGREDVMLTSSVGKIRLTAANDMLELVGANIASTASISNAFDSIRQQSYNGGIYIAAATTATIVAPTTDITATSSITLDTSIVNVDASTSITLDTAILNVNTTNAINISSNTTVVSGISLSLIGDNIEIKANSLAIPGGGASISLLDTDIAINASVTGIVNLNADICNMNSSRFNLPTGSWMPAPEYYVQDTPDNPLGLIENIFAEFTFPAYTGVILYNTSMSCRISPSWLESERAFTMFTWLDQGSGYVRLLRFANDQIIYIPNTIACYGNSALSTFVSVTNLVGIKFTWNCTNIHTLNNNSVVNCMLMNRVG